MPEVAAKSYLTTVAPELLTQEGREGYWAGRVGEKSLCIGTDF